MCCSKVEAKPFILVIGVLNSWETVLTNSLCSWSISLLKLSTTKNKSFPSFSPLSLRISVCLVGKLSFRPSFVNKTATWAEKAPSISNELSSSGMK